MRRLEKKTALITGGTSGIGLETARLFIREGARVAITGRTPKNLAEAQSVLGADVIVLPSDAGDPAAQKELARAIEQEFGRLDVLFANAGIVDMRPFDQVDPASLQQSFAINFTGPFLLIQALLPVFANPASVILNASVNAHLGMPNTSVYGATKAALLSLTRTLSAELIPRGIRVNAVSPGPIATPLYDKLGSSESESAAISEAIRRQIPVGRFGTASEVAHAVVFFASDESQYAVGSELVIGGGIATL